MLTFLIGSSVDAGPLNFGTKVGLSAATQDYNYTSDIFSVDKKYRYGFAAGVFANYNIIGFVPVRLEFNYLQKGSKEEFSLTGPSGPAILGTYTVDDRIDYLSIKVVATPLSSVKPISLPYLIIGPRLDIKLSTSSDFPSLVLDDLKSTVLGGTIGIGRKIPMGPTGSSLIIEAVYDHDFTDSYESPTLKVRNRNFQLSVGLMF